MLSALSASAAPAVLLRSISLELVESGEFQNSEESKVPMQKTHAPFAKGGKKVAPLLFSIRHLLAA